MSQAKLQKSSSAALMKVEFNPCEFSIGQSRIQKLLIHPESRRHSTSNIDNVKPNLPHGELATMRRLNEALQRENSMLKQELEKLRSSNKAPRVPHRDIQGKPNYKQLISKAWKCNSRLTTECETGVFSSKQVSCGDSEQTISQYYQSYTSKGGRPNFTDLEEVSKKFFKDFQDNYTKLSYMLGHLESNSLPGFAKLQEQMALYRIPLIYARNPQVVMRELSRDRSRQKEKVLYEAISPQETVRSFQNILSRLVKSSKLMCVLRGNELVREFLTKYSELPRQCRTN